MVNVASDFGQLFTLGLNHHTAPVSIRERVAFQPERLPEALHDLTGRAAVNEATILSTCNRTEVYFTGQSPAEAIDWLSAFHHVPRQDIAPYLYTFPQREAVRHVFRVASGLDSMVLGETQILGQVKTAVQTAQQAGTMGAMLHKLFQNTFSVAKEVRSCTSIGANTVSMAAASVQLAERVFGQISEQTVLFIGAGEMIELCAAHFASLHPRRIAVANRTEARGKKLADRFRAETMRLNVIGDVLSEFDIIVSCTASPLPIVGLGMVERSLKARRHKPMVIVDLAVPRDVEAEVANLDDAFLYTIDDLKHIVDQGVLSRQHAVVDAEQIIDTRVDGFLQWLHSRKSVPTIRSLRNHAEAMRVAEIHKALKMLEGGRAPQQVLEALSQGLINKLLHHPSKMLNSGDETRRAETSRWVETLFDLDRDA